MDQALGWYFPAGEKHLPAWMKKMNMARVHTYEEPGPAPNATGQTPRVKKTDRRLLYQGNKYNRIWPWVRKERRGAIDVGGHIGLWSWQMAQDFKRVWAFEPMPEHQECFRMNMAHLHNWTLYPFALGADMGEVHIRTRTVGSSGDTGIDLTGNGVQVQMRKLDDFGLTEIDFLKVDCEGFEVFVMQGAVETLKANRPCIVIEQKPETGMEANYKIGTTDAVKFLESLGAKRREVISGDYIMSW